MNKQFSIVSLFLAAALSVPAQFGPPRGGPPGPPEMNGFMHQQLVTGIPYSATVTNTIVEHLSDGNTIQRTTAGQVARDGQGRTYDQQTITGGPLAEGGPKTITFVSDPVAGFSYMLDASRKVAMRRSFRAPKSPPDGEFHHEPKGANVTESDLAPDSSTGVQAEGKLITHTIPAGAIGNSQPIVSTVQRWYSNDLKLVVKSVRNDPRFGTTTYALSNVVRSEPDPALFQVPADYTVQDAPSPHGGPGPGHPPDLP